jgi:hypothetical protein
MEISTKVSTAHPKMPWMHRDKIQMELVEISLYDALVELDPCPKGTHGVQALMAAMESNERMYIGLAP